eukprot:919127-Alexandrium_andersonii.AAC.1
MCIRDRHPPGSGPGREAAALPPVAPLLDPGLRGQLQAARGVQQGGDPMVRPRPPGHTHGVQPHAQWRRTQQVPQVLRRRQGRQKGQFLPLAGPRQHGPGGLRPPGGQAPAQ